MSKKTEQGIYTGDKHMNAYQFNAYEFNINLCRMRNIT